ncbi:non-canonical purine NTP diphosphatase [Robertkochia marina]|uniref:dITP/XTP pyrophosphatase n=1 Tax=Robertkochia marina TaxID=1227945 RepID=A0A4S3M0C3_9FLAO|nr:non-canonical purine NTP diphosphatase [Robertkochia marina]THD67487.1 non-canonical purine NTP diphosphatase [Robertkochia marina]TRZ44697.1 non-canonical purine NTP diphosphatase [Robertkochia marina]
MKLVFATHNKNKLKEVKALLPKHIEILSLDDIGCHEEIPEEADTIEENAIGKANYIRDQYGYNCFADDTGLEVKALKGAPGVYSARYAGPEKNDQSNVKKLLKDLEDKDDRTARFKTVIALNLENEKILFQGIAKGEITTAPKGDKGFGYDPVFKPEGFEKTFAELPLSEKNKISHRAKAMKQLIDYFRS